MMTIPAYAAYMIVITMPLQDFILTSTLWMGTAAVAGGIIAWNVKEPVMQTAYAISDSIGSTAIAWQETVGETSLNWFGF